MKKIRHVLAYGCALSFMVLGGVAARADAIVDRGAYLMNSIVACGNCHTPKGPDGKPLADRELSGGAAIEAPIFSAVPSNITPDPETGIGKWTDAQIIDAIRNGKRPDGSIIGPPMPIAFYRDMSDNDAKAIVAYLRQVKPVSNKSPKSTYKVPLPPSYGPPVTTVADVPHTDKVAYGGYMATALGHCMDCHTPLVEGRNDMARLGAGGNVFEAPGGGIVRSANLTPGLNDGLAKWTDQALKTSIKEGVRPDGSKLVRLMAFDYYKNISDADMDSLVAYIRQLKPVR
jgi:mono/diheme cytochrome c family protein